MASHICDLHVVKATMRDAVCPSVHATCPLRPDLTRLIVCSRCTTVSRRCCSTCSRFTRRVQGRAMMSLVRALAERSRGGEEICSRNTVRLNPFTVQIRVNEFSGIFVFSVFFSFFFFFLSFRTFIDNFFSSITHVLITYFY